MRVNVIYDSRRFEKYDLLMSEFESQGIDDYKIWDCIMLPNVVESISESFKMIIQKAKDNGLKEVCLAEDDVMFPNKNGWEYFLENKPKDYDVYIGGSYLVDMNNVYAAPLVKVNEWVGNQLIIVNEKYYDKWLNTNSKDHCDTVHKGLGDFYVCFPFAALQRSGWSANMQTTVNYNNQIPKEYIY